MTYPHQFRWCAPTNLVFYYILTCNYHKSNNRRSLNLFLHKCLDHTPILFL